MPLSDYFDKKTAPLKAKAAAGLLSIFMTSGCAHIASQKFDDYNVCMDPEKFSQRFGSGSKDDGMCTSLIKFPAGAAAASCYMVQELARFPSLVIALPECAIRNATADTPEEKENLPPFCDFK